MMKTGRTLASTYAPALLLAAASLALSGCLSGGGAPPPEILHHVVEYAPPAGPDLPAVDAVVKVGRFVVSPLYDSPEMFYRTEPYERRSYNYHRWIADPGRIVASSLLRDLRVSGLFRAVLSVRSMEPTRFRLTGEVEEFLEVDEGESGSASLVVQVFLWDEGGEGPAGRLLMQERYSLRGPEEPKTAEGLAASMSRAMRELARRVLGDVHDAVLKAGPADG